MRAIEEGKEVVLPMLLPVHRGSEMRREKNEGVQSGTQYISNLSRVARIDAWDEQKRAHSEIRRRIERVKGGVPSFVQAGVYPSFEHLNFDDKKIMARLAVIYLCIDLLFAAGAEVELSI